MSAYGCKYKLRIIAEVHEGMTSESTIIDWVGNGSNSLLGNKITRIIDKAG
jgi:hypothetical protein